MLLSVRPPYIMEPNAGPVTPVGRRLAAEDAACERPQVDCASSDCCAWAEAASAIPRTTASGAMRDFKMLFLGVGEPEAGRKQRSEPSIVPQFAEKESDWLDDSHGPQIGLTPYSVISRPGRASAKPLTFRV